MSLTLKIGEKKIRVKDSEVVIGRDSSCEIIIQEPSVSRRHAVIVHEQNGIFLKDLGSILGSTINGKKVEGKTPIFKGDKIGISNMEIEVISGPKKPQPGLTKDLQPVPEGDSKITEETDSTNLFRGRPKLANQKKSRLKNPLYVVLIFIVFLLVVLVAVASLKPSNSKKTKSLSQAKVTKLTAEYLDKTPSVSTEGLEPKQIEERAKDFFDNAESKYNLMHMRYGQPYEAYLRYQKALMLLDKIESRPQYYDRLLHHMGKSRSKIEESIITYMQEGWVASKQGKWKDAYQSYEIVIATIPKEDFPVSEEARRQMQKIAIKLPKRK